MNGNTRCCCFSYDFARIAGWDINWYMHAIHGHVWVSVHKTDSARPLSTAAAAAKKNSLAVDISTYLINWENWSKHSTSVPFQWTCLYQWWIVCCLLCLTHVHLSVSVYFCIGALHWHLLLATIDVWNEHTLWYSCACVYLCSYPFIRVWYGTHRWCSVAVATVVAFDLTFILSQC